MDKRIAPTIVMILVVFFILLQAGGLVFVFTREGLGLFWSALIILIPLGIIVSLIAVYIERMKEIDEEEKDDMSQY